MKTPRGTAAFFYPKDADLARQLLPSECPARNDQVSDHSTIGRYEHAARHFRAAVANHCCRRRWRSIDPRWHARHPHHARGRKGAQALAEEAEVPCARLEQAERARYAG